MRYVQLAFAWACSGALMTRAAPFVDYEALRGATPASDRLNMLGGQRDEGLVATFEFEDLLSYSYEYGEASRTVAEEDRCPKTRKQKEECLNANDKDEDECSNLIEAHERCMRLERLKIASSADGGFGVDFNLGNMNFGPDSDLGLSNSGRRDGYYVNAASFQGFTDLGFLGASVAPAGDVDGDGVDDIIIGAPGVRHVYVLFGSSEYDSSARRRRLQSKYPPWADQKSNVGTFETAINALGENAFMILREDNTDQEDSAFGSQVTTAGDVNGDGFDDILIGASGDGVGSSLVSQGRVYVFFGGDRTTLTGHGAWDLTSSGHTGFPIERGFRIEGDANFRGVGQSISGGFDLNDDGFDDFLIGVETDSKNGHVDDVGEAVLVYGTNEFDRSILPLQNLAGKGGSMNPRGVILALKNKDGAGKKALLGLEMAALDDVNGDGHDDIAVGAPQYGDGGAAFVIFGGIQYHGTLFLDEMDGSDGFGILGAKKGDLCGGDVKKAGDFNGDGYGDIIVGAAGFEHRRGAAYIVLGRKHFGPTVRADISFRGDVAKDMAGYSVSSAGDVDGDGLDDVLIGAFTSSPQAREMAGTVYCVLGGSKKKGTFDLSDLNGFDGFTMYGEHSGDGAGFDVAAAADFNNDGIDDIIVSSVFQKGSASNKGGNAYVIFGQHFNSKAPTTMPTGPSAMPTPAPSRPTYSLGNEKLPFPSKVALSSIQGMSAGSILRGEETLPSIAFIGDVDFDGIDDFVAAADGKAYLIYGAANDDIFAGDLNSITTQTSGNFVGAAIEAPCSIQVVASAGDFNLDGHDDMALACPADNDSTGTVFVVFGGDGFPETNIISLESDMMLGVDYIQLQGGSNGDGFGSSLSTLDFNNDGYADVVIGAPQSSCAYVYYGMASTALSASIVDATTFGPTEGFRLTHDQSDLGSSVAGIGDINDDGYDDVAVGAPAAATVCVVFGNEYMRNDDAPAEYKCDDLDPDSDNSPGFMTFTSSEGGDKDSEERYIGVAVSAAGDVNGDSYADFLVGAPGVDHGSGMVYIMLGKPDNWKKKENTKKAMPIVSSLRRGALGSAVAGAGDINNDGLDDILIGASNGLDRTASEPGTAYVVFGSASLVPAHASIDVRMLDGSDGFALTGTNLGAQAGAAVALGTFDVNNDGIDDLMVGEPGAHQAFVLFGISVGTVDTHEPSQMPTTDTWVPTSSPKPTGGFPTPRPTKQPTPRPTPMPTGAFPTPMPTKDMPTPRPSTSTPTSPISPTAPTDGGGSTGSSSSSDSGSSSSSNSGGGVDAASAGIIGGVVAGAAVLFILAMVVYRNKSRDEQASLADDVDRITIEAEAARPQPTPVDQASMSSGVNDMSMVEAPASMVTDVQEKIIEADL